ncbi:hypothetical protein [Streptomyces pilosus]|uniref:Uncharacterized protein n=1 Tax=Streptomyces pilosus TaxID=28893 RepID=A0A918BXN3_9ACTN|nr:hypothetical protein [Streptomyces pilosus]GGQ95639.1 hypothetical protein GCM10010280_48860 [Streptomyces pilosus]
MTYTDHRTLRRDLRREIAATIGVLTDEHDFRAMRRYTSFAFDDHTTYLEHLEALLRTRARQGSHTTVTLFDPADYAEFCASTGLDPDSHTSRSRFAAALATTGPAVPYDGRPLADLLPTLVDEAVRQATWEYAATLLARLGPCASCGEDLGRAAFARASHLLARILDTAPPGERHLVCSVSGPPETLVAALHTDDTTGRTEADESEGLEFTAVLAVGLATAGPGGLVMRISRPGVPDRVHGWRLRAHRLEALTAGEVFDAYCTDAESGDLIAPESDVDYCEAPDLGEEDGPGGAHRH